MQRRGLHLLVQMNYSYLEIGVLTRGHLTLQDRIVIQPEFNQGSSFNAIARLISKNHTTLFPEIRNHLLIRDRSSSSQSRMINDCIHPFECRLKFVCQPQCHFQKENCRFCGHCFRVCPDYEKEYCPSLVLLMFVMAAGSDSAAPWNNVIIRLQKPTKNIGRGSLKSFWI